MACDAAGKAAFSFWSNIGVYISHVLLGKLVFFSTIFNDYGLSLRPRDFPSVNVHLSKLPVL